MQWICNRTSLWVELVDESAVESYGLLVADGLVVGGVPEVLAYGLPAIHGEMGDAWSEAFSRLKNNVVVVFLEELDGSPLVQR